MKLPELQARAKHLGISIENEDKGKGRGHKKIKNMTQLKSQLLGLLLGLVTAIGCIIYEKIVHNFSFAFLQLINIVTATIFFIIGYLDDKYNITPNIKNFLQNEPSLKQKKDQLCFFGSDTGNIDETLLNQRVTFCLKSINKEKITAKITNFVNFSKDELRDLGMDPDSIESSFVSIKEQLFYKFILDLDGYSSSWDRTAWAMASNSYLIHIKSNLQKFLTWYYPFIEKNNILPFYTQEEVLNLF
jgi:hypothetical protein